MVASQVLLDTSQIRDTDPLVAANFVTVRVFVTF
jgi:hypothetical protein